MVIGKPSERGAAAKTLRVEAADNDGQATMSRAELMALMREAVASVLAETEQKPLLVDKHVMAHLVGCSAAHIDALRKRGLPTVMVGMNVRFVPEDVLAWLREGHAA